MGRANDVNTHTPSSQFLRAASHISNENEREQHRKREQVNFWFWLSMSMHLTWTSDWDDCANDNENDWEFKLITICFDMDLIQWIGPFYEHTLPFFFLLRQITALFANCCLVLKRTDFFKWSAFWHSINQTNQLLIEMIAKFFFQSRYWFLSNVFYIRKTRFF